MGRVSVLLATLIGCLSQPSSGQGPGLGNLTYTSSEVGKTLGLIVNREGHGWVAMHRGYLVVIFSRDGGLGDGAISMVDVSNPRSPQTVFIRDDSVTKQLREPHGWGMRGDIAALQSNYGIHFWNFADPFSPQLVSSLNLPQITISDYDQGMWWTHWQGGYLYGGGSGNGLYIVDAKDPANPAYIKRIPTTQTGGFRIGPVHAVGNLLFLSSMDAQGASVMDISDPVDPKLMAVLSPTNSGTGAYASMVNGKRWVFAGANFGNRNNDGRALIYDITNPSTPVDLGRSAPLPAGSGDNKGGYVGFQDGYAFLGFSVRGFAKIDLTQPNFPVVATGTSGLPNHDEDFAIPLGNLVFVANDHPGQGSALMPHRTGRDTVGPAVNMINPSDSAVKQALTSRVGATFTDQVEGLSVDSTTFKVRPLGGAALKGWYAVQNGVVNFQPELPLLPNTTYEVLVSAGGIRDYVGNTVPATFRSVFSTGDSIGTTSVRKAAAKAKGVGRIPAAATVLYSRPDGSGSPADALGRSIPSPRTPAASAGLEPGE